MTGGLESSSPPSSSSSPSRSGSSAAARWERSSEVLWRRTASGVAVLPIDSSAAVTLEGLHAALWEALVRPVPVDALVDPLATFLPGEPAAAARELNEAVRFMVAAGAVRESVEP
jgi:hypothetical protein